MNAKTRARDAKGRFTRKPRLLDADQLAAAESFVLRLEDQQPSCLNLAWALTIHPSFWGEGANRPPKELA